MSVTVMAVGGGVDNCGWVTVTSTQGGVEVTSNSGPVFSVLALSLTTRARRQLSPPPVDASVTLVADPSTETLLEYRHPPEMGDSEAEWLMAAGALVVGVERLSPGEA